MANIINKSHICDKQAEKFMASYKLKKGDNLALALSIMKTGDKLEVPFRLCAEQSIRTAAWRARKETNAVYEVNVVGNARAVVSRL